MTSNVSGNAFSKTIDGNVYSRIDNPDSKIAGKVLELGPLEGMFPCTASKILDFMFTFKDYDYSISDIARNSGVSFKTTLKEVNKLASENVIFKNRNVGRAMLFKINPDSSKSRHLEKLSSDIAMDHAVKMAEQEMTNTV